MHDRHPRSSSRLGIIISMFPELHETFILRELVALERRGVRFDIFSLQYPRDPITLDDAIRLSTERTHYSTLISLSTLAAFARDLVKQPVSMLQAIKDVIWQGRDRPMDILKNLAVLPISMHIAAQGNKLGITHWHGHWANIPTTACWYINKIHNNSWSAAIHGEDIFSTNRFLRHKLNDARFSVVCSDYFCKHLKNEMRLDNPEHVHLNYHGLDPQVTQRQGKSLAEVSARAGVFSIVSIGRLVPTKGHDTLISACASLLKNDLPVALQIVGSGPQEQQLRELAMSLGIEKQVHFHGAMAFDAVLKTLEQADAFVLAPRLIPGQPPDGIPNVIAEAMALGVPVISTRVSAIPELVGDGVSGLLVNVDDTDALASAINTLYAKPELALQYSEAARKRVGQLFDQNENIDELLALFQRYVQDQFIETAIPAS